MLGILLVKRASDDPKSVVERRCTRENPCQYLDICRRTVRSIAVSRVSQSTCAPARRAEEQCDPGSAWREADEAQASPDEARNKF